MAYTEGLFAYNDRVSNMRERHLRIIVVMAALLLLDLTRPFDYAIYVEFLLLGVIAVFLIYPYSAALIWAIAAGYFRDCFDDSASPVSVIEFVFIFLIVRYFLRRFPAVPVQRYLPPALIVMDAGLHAAVLRKASWFFCLEYFTQAIVLFFLLQHILTQWMKFRPARYT